MNDFHQAVARYRECSRHVRNVYFQPPDESPTAWDLTEGWEEVDRMLFNWMVLYPHDLQPALNGLPYEKIKLRLHGAYGATAFINRDKGKNHGYWDYPVKVLRSADCTLTFRQFFDWDKLAPVDFTYVMAAISNARNDDLNGRLALIEWQHVEFQKDDPANPTQALSEPSPGR